MPQAEPVRAIQRRTQPRSLKSAYAALYHIFVPRLFPLQLRAELARVIQRCSKPMQPEQRS